MRPLPRLVASVLAATLASSGCATTSGARKSDDIAVMIIGACLLTGLVIGIATDDGTTRPPPSDPPPLPEPH